jgi:pimeloyl-ACP methyl ester carboxylesterase
MRVQQETTAAEATMLRRHVLPTELGPCTVHVQSGLKQRGPASATADVYLHGAAGSWTTFQPLLAGVPDRARVLIDLPGWGGSTENARMEHFSIDAVGRAVVGILDSLGYRRWNLVGHSMGGFLALHIAAAWPEQTASVAAISATTFGVSQAARHPLRGFVRLPAFVGMLLLMRALAALGPAGSALVHATGNAPVMRPLMAPFFAVPAAIPAGIIRGLGDDARPASFAAAARTAASYDLDRWRSIRCPVLATRGDADVFTPQSDLDRLGEVVPHAQLVTIPRCGHFANFERPLQVMRLLDGLWGRRIQSAQRPQ